MFSINHLRNDRHQVSVKTPELSLASPRKETQNATEIYAYEPNHAAVKDILASYGQHQLSDLGKASLMDRVDTKFLLPIAALPQLLLRLRNSHSALTIGQDTFSTYQNTYFDTENLDFYRDHHNERANRFKVRQRHYVESDIKFLEVKQKTNKKRTKKYRINVTDSGTMQTSKQQLIKKHLGMNLEELNISQYSGYQRIALADISACERLTLDFNLWFKAPKNERVFHIPNMFIAELKQQRLSKSTPAYTEISKLGYRPDSLSKYCVGCALTYNKQVKSNRFKPILNRLKVA